MRKGPRHPWRLSSSRRPVSNAASAASIADFIAGFTDLPPEGKQELLETFDLKKRLEKQPGWSEFPAGEWKFRSFAPDGTPSADSAARCFACHTKVRDQDFVFSLDRMKLARN